MVKEYLDIANDGKENAAGKAISQDKLQVAENEQTPKIFICKAFKKVNLNAYTERPLNYVDKFLLKSNSIGLAIACFVLFLNSRKFLYLYRLGKS